MRVKQIVPAILTSIFLFWMVAFAQEAATEVSPGSATGQDAVVESAANKGTAELVQEGSEANLLWVQDASGAAGAVSTVKVLLTVDQDVYGAQFDLVFDQSKLQIKPLAEDGVSLGSGAGGLVAPVLDEEAVTSANSQGTLVVMMVDTTLAAPLTAGAEKELFSVKFAVDADAEVGDVPITLANVSFATVVEEAAVDVEVSTQDGKVTVAEFQKGDVSGDGNVNIFDLLDLLKVLSGTGTAGGAADVNSDGKTDIFDLLELLKTLAGT